MWLEPLASQLSLIKYVLFCYQWPIIKSSIGSVVVLIGIQSSGCNVSYSFKSALFFCWFCFCKRKNSSERTQRHIPWAGSMRTITSSLPARKGLACGEFFSRWSSSSVLLFSLIAASCRAFFVKITKNLWVLESYLVVLKSFSFYNFWRQGRPKSIRSFTC